MTELGFKPEPSDSRFQGVPSPGHPAAVTRPQNEGRNEDMTRKTNKEKSLKLYTPPNYDATYQQNVTFCYATIKKKNSKTLKIFT